MALNIKKTNDNLTKPDQSLSQRAVRGGFWGGALRIVVQLFGLARLVILARILAPHDFGLMGVALLTMATLDIFSQTGFQTALIQRKGNTEDYLDSAWTIEIIRGLVIFTILYLIAPYAATFFKESQATPIIRVIGFSILLQSFTNIGVIYFQKELEFNKQFVYQLAGILADFIVAVSAVLILRNVWALVFGLLAGNAARFIVSYLIHPYRPHLSFDLGKAKEIFGFGKWVLGTSILMFLLTQGDDIFVGKFLGVAMLGFYQMAYKISNMTATEITHVISQVTFPVYSKLQDDIPRLREAYLKVLQITALLSFPIAGLIFVLAPDFTRIFLGAKWMSMVPAMQVLCIFGVTRAINATMGPILYSVGKPKLLTKLSGIQLIIMAAIIYPLTLQWGILGASLAVVIPNTVVLILISIEVKNILNATYKDFFISIIAPVVAVFVMFLFLPLIYKFIPYNPNIYNLLLMSILIIVVYIAIIYLWDRKTGYKIRYEIHKIFSNFKGE